MNTLKATLCTTMVLGATLLIAKPALATQFVAADSSPGTQACMAVAANKSYVVRKASRDLNISKAVMSKKLHCNNLSMGDFVTLYNLDKSANYLHCRYHKNMLVCDSRKVNNKWGSNKA